MSASSIPSDEIVKEKHSFAEDQHKHTVENVENVLSDTAVAVKYGNPLSRVTRDELAGHVDSFVADYGLEDLAPVLHRGALVAQDPLGFEHMPELSAEEVEALRFERDHKWRHPLAMYLTVVVCAMGACVQGWDQTGSSGANLSFPTEFGIPISDATSPDYNKNNWIVGVINAAPYIGAWAFSCWFTDPINHLIGRRGTIFLACIFCIAGPLGSAFTHKWWQLFICRILLGFGVGFKETTAPVLAAENSPANIRGAMVTSWQMWTAFGIFLGYSANLVVYRVGRIAWRLQLGSALIPAIPLIMLVYLVPESPRWYVKRHRVRDAWRSLLKLRRHEIQAARDLYGMYVLIAAERAAIRGTSLPKRMAQLFYKPRLRQATLAATVVMFARELCGVNIIAFFSSTIFQETTGSVTKAMWASFGFGLINFVFAFPALWTIDTFGRRSLLLFTFPHMFWSLLAAGLGYLASDPTTRLALVALFVYIFTAFYSPGEGPVPFVYASEIFPVSHRELGMAWSVIVNNFLASVLSVTFFRMRAKNALTVPGSFGFYAGLNLVSFVLIFLFVPETKQMSLEELDQVFSVPTKTFIKYQFSDAVPYFVRRYIRRDKTARLVPLVNTEPLANPWADGPTGKV